MTMINKQMQAVLGLDVPESVQPESTITLPVVVEPHELPNPVDNPAAPDISDINRRQAEGEKQLEELIHIGQTILKKLYQDELPNTMPKLKRGVMEQIAVMYGNVLEAVSHKNKLQLEKSKDRRAQAGFVKKDKAASSGGTTNMFFGTREQALDELVKMKLIEDDK